MNNICRICLSTTKDLNSLSNEHIKLYINLVDHIVYKEHMMDVCTGCQWMLHKFAKFKHRCWMANSYLKEAVYLDSKSIPQNDHSSPHLTQTTPIIHSYNPTQNTRETRIYTHKTSHDILNPSLDTPTHEGLNNQQNHNFVTFEDQNCHTNNEKQLNDNYIYIDTNNKYIDENNTHDENNTSDRNINENDIYINDNEETIHDNCDTINDNNETINDNLIDDYDEDDVPLILIKDKSKGRVKKKGRGKKKDVEDKTDGKQETVKEEAELYQTEDKSRSKKPLRTGFSSRMVQETNEYIVIKLTREQVLQEMSERSKTAAYLNSPFKCEDCVKAFNFQDVLDTHMEKHSLKNGTFLCDMCAQYCPSAVSLRGHIKSHTTRYQCKLCGTVRASRQHLMEHHAGHSGSAPAYQCLHCAFTTNKRTVMQRHARRHSRTEAYACRDCGKQFKTIDYLRLHAARHAKSPRFACGECPATSAYHSVLRRHVRDVHERREFYCVECDVHFKCAESLRVHFKRAKRHRDSTALNHACPKCPARFFTASALGTHLASSHDAFKQHTCHHCHRAYSTKDAVRAHIWRVHSKGDNRASCLHCGQTFSRKSALKAHIRTHEAVNDARTNTQADKQEKDALLLFEDKIEV